MSDTLNMAMEQSFRAVAQAVDRLTPEQTTDFLARLVLVLANELQNADKFEVAVQRALAPVKQELPA